MASNHRSLKFTIFLKQRNKLQTFKIKKMTRRRTRPETPPHIRQDTRYKTPELEETHEDRRRRKSRKLSAAKNYYKALNSLNTTTLNPIGASTHSTTQAQLVQRRPRMNYNLARSSIKTFKPTVSLTNCCRNEKVVLAPLGNAPESIIKLLTQNSPITEELYLKHIHSFNSVFAFTSMGASIDCDLADGTNRDCAQKFSQIYIYDGSFEAKLHHRHNVFPFLDHDILTDIQYDLHMHNPFAQVFRSAGQFIRGGQPIMLKLLSGQDEVAVLLIENNAN
ncbi:7668_t:CDS:2, partial [Racocetra fulgida]